MLQVPYPTMYPMSRDRKRITYKLSTAYSVKTTLKVEYNRVRKSNDLISHLHVADGDAVVDGVPHHLVLHLLPTPKRLFHQDLVAQRQRFSPQLPVAL